VLPGGNVAQDELEGVDLTPTVQTWGVRPRLTTVPDSRLAVGRWGVGSVRGGAFECGGELAQRVVDRGLLVGAEAGVLASGVDLGDPSL
jgi:hypothetical protein